MYIYNACKSTQYVGLINLSILLSLSLSLSLSVISYKYYNKFGNDNNITTTNINDNND